MRKLAALCCLAFLLAVGPAWPASRAGGADAACAAARDAALDMLDQEAVSLAIAFDNDAAVADAPEYELLKAKEALLEEIGRERQAVLARYRRCIGDDTPAR